MPNTLKIALYIGILIYFILILGLLKKGFFRYCNFSFSSISGNYLLVFCIIWNP